MFQTHYIATLFWHHNNNNTVRTLYSKAQPRLRVFIHTCSSFVYVPKMGAFGVFLSSPYCPLTSDWVLRTWGGSPAVSRLSSVLYLCASSTYLCLSVCPASRKEHLSASYPPLRLGRCAPLVSCAPPANRLKLSVAASRHKVHTKPPFRATLSTSRHRLGGQGAGAPGGCSSLAPKGDQRSVGQKHCTSFMMDNNKQDDKDRKHQTLQHLQIKCFWNNLNFFFLQPSSFI